MNTYPGQRGSQAQTELAARRLALRGSGLDWPLAAFWLTAGLAAIAAYDARQALAKFWIISLSIGIFYAIAGLGGKYTRPVAYSLAALGAAISIGFLLLHDWSLQPADFGAINRVGQWIMGLRPELWPVETAPNRVAGVLAALLPPVLAVAMSRPRRNHCSVAGTGGPGRHGTAISDGGWSQRSVAGTGGPGSGKSAGRLASPQLWAGLASIVMAFGLFMTSSRAAWMALLAGGAAWLLLRLEAWWAAADNGWYRRNRRRIHLAAALALFVLLLLGLALSEELVIALDRGLPGEASALSRQRIMLNGLRLAEDFLYLGGGLGAFPGLYSEYMLVVPYYSFGYAHNLYVDVGIEQGAFGAVMLIIILIAGLGFSREVAERCPGGIRRRLAQAVFAGLVVMLVHGLADDAFYGEGGTPLLFLLPALAVHLKQQIPEDEPQRVPRPLNRPNRRWRLAGLGLAAGVLALFFFTNGRSQLYANLGALEMARLQLAGFPAESWSLATDAREYKRAKAWLQKSAAADAHNRTANQRIGLIYLREGNFEGAVRFLERAYAEDPRHVGVVKNLGYAHLWLGRPEKALPLLASLPEASQELEAYAGWWRSQGELELAERAWQMSRRLR